MLVRMALVPVSYAAKRFCRSVSVTRASSLRTAGRRSVSLPLSEPVQDVAERPGVLAEEERDFGIDFVRRCERVGVLGDALRQHRELVRELDLAQAAAALRDLRATPAARGRAARCCRC